MQIGAGEAKENENAVWVLIEDGCWVKPCIAYGFGIGWSSLDYGTFGVGACDYGKMVGCMIAIEVEIEVAIANVRAFVVAVDGFDLN